MSEVRKNLDASLRDASNGMITNEFVAQYIDKIFATVDDDMSVRLEIKIFTGKSTEKYMQKLNARSKSRTGHTMKIMKRIRQLADFPEIGAPLSSIISLEVPYRFLVCGNYTAFYKVEGDEIHIIRVLYGRRNFMQILFGRSYDE